MPPQAALVLGGLGWNYARSLHGQTTISMFLRRHPVATAVGLAVVNGWLVPHLYLKET